MTIPLAHPISITWLGRHQLPAVLAIEVASFAEPWDEQRLLETLRRQHMIGSGLTLDGRLVGYAVYQLLATRVDLLRLAVAPGYRQRGYGAALVERARSKVASGRNRLEVMVPDDWLGAHLFLRGCGLRCVATARGVGDEPDTYRFVWRLPIAAREGPESVVKPGHQDCGG